MRSRDKLVVVVTTVAGHVLPVASRAPTHRNHVIRRQLQCSPCEITTLSIRGGGSDHDGRGNGKGWMNQLWNNLAGNDDNENEDKRRLLPIDQRQIRPTQQSSGNQYPQYPDLQPPPPPIDDGSPIMGGMLPYPPNHPWQKRQQQEQQPDENAEKSGTEVSATQLERRQYNNTAPSDSQPPFDKSEAMMYQQRPPPPPLFYPPPMYNTMGPDPSFGYYYDGPPPAGPGPMLPDPNNPFLYPPPTQGILADLQATISSLQYQLGSTQESLHNTTSSCSHYETLSASLEQQLEACQEELRASNIKTSQYELEVLELQEKCDTLQKLRISYEQEMQQLQDQCSAYQEQQVNDTEKFASLQEIHQTTLDEMTVLATAMEKHRIRLVELDEEEEERERLRSQVHSKHHKAKKSKSLLAKLLAFFLGSSSSEDEGTGSSSDDEEDYQEAQKLAHKTLLSALSQTRDYASELESSLEAYEQNCTTLKEQLQSKVELIDELHDRIAVFEEDKVVLKAALQQLRKEMRVEEDKRVDLERNLKQKDAEIESLVTQIKQLQSNHSAQVSALEREIQAKNITLTDHLNTLEEIGIYVDKLEQRLVSLTSARDKALLDADAAANATAYAAKAKAEQQEYERNITSLMQEELQVMQQEHAQEILLYNEQVAKIKIDLERSLSDKDLLQSQLQEMTMERDRLVNETKWIQSQMRELQLNLIEVARQLELERSNAVVGKGETELQTEEDKTEEEKQEVSRDENGLSDSMGGKDAAKRSDEHERYDDKDVPTDDEEHGETSVEEVGSEDDALFVEEVQFEEQEAQLPPPPLPFLDDETNHASVYDSGSDEPQVPSSRSDPSQADSADACAQTAESNVEEQQSMQGGTGINNGVPNVRPGGGSVSGLGAQARSTTTPLFVASSSPSSTMQLQRTPKQAQPKPLRQIRKAFSHLTGMHGFFSGSNNRHGTYPTQPPPKGMGHPKLSLASMEKQHQQQSRQ